MMSVILVSKLYPTFCDPHGLCGVPQTRMLECVAISFSRGSSWPRDRTHVSCLIDEFFSFEASREALEEIEYFKKNRNISHKKNISQLPGFPLMIEFYIGGTCD